MEEGVLLKADIHEHGLEPLLDVLDAAFVNAADEMGAANSFDGVFLKHAVLHKSDSALEFLAVDDDSRSAIDVLLTSKKLLDSSDDSQSHK